MLAVKLVVEPAPAAEKLAGWRGLELPALGVLGTVCLTIWAGYGFHVGTLDSIRLSGVSLGDALPPTIAHARMLPAPEFWHGLVILLWYSENMPAYVLGSVSASAPWYFFPLAIGVKSPLGFLGLGVIGLVAATWLGWRKRNWRAVAVPALVLAMLGAGMRSPIAIGGRQMLPIYPVLAVLAGVGAALLWRTRAIGKLVAVALGGWLVLASVRAHPDYLANFNELASDRPGHYFLSSDLDFGQDVSRLSDTVRARGIDSITVYLFSLPDRLLLPSPSYVAYPEWHYETPPPVTGWIAASAWVLYGIPGMPWLRAHTPVAKVGKTIYLYHIPPGDATESR
jgi:hypothetical protein